MEDYKRWRFCPICGLALVESRLLHKEPNGFVTLQVGCTGGHAYLLTEDPHRREVVLRAWETQAQGTI